MNRRLGTAWKHCSAGEQLCSSDPYFWMCVKQAFRCRLRALVGAARRAAQHCSAPAVCQHPSAFGGPLLFPPALVLVCVPNSAHVEAHEQQFSGIRACGNLPVWKWGGTACTKPSSPLVMIKHLIAFSLQLPYSKPSIIIHSVTYTLVYVVVLRCETCIGDRCQMSL